MSDSKLKAVIFDLDGVIVFTDKFHYQAWKKMADEIGVYFDEEINNRLRGVGRMESLDIILERYEGEPLSQEYKKILAAKKNDMYRELLYGMGPDDVTSEVRETLAELRNRGYKLSIGSSSKNAKLILRQIRLTDAFDAISDGTNISKSKPDPEVFIKAAEYLDVPCDNCLVVEDASAGIDAAKAGHMYAAGIGDAMNYSLTDYPLTSFKDLLDICK